MRILLVNAHGADLAFGGAERYVADLRDGLERGGDEVTVLSAFPVAADGSTRLRVLHATDWREDRLRRLRTHAEGWTAVSTPRLRELIAELAPELVHTSNLFGITTAIWECAAARQVPVVHTLHDYGLLCPRTTLMRRDGSPCRPNPLLCGLRTRSSMRHRHAVAAVIGVSAQLLRAHAGRFGVETSAHVVYPPLVPTLPVGGAPPAADAPATVGYLGALDVHKGIESLLAAAPGLAELGLRVRVAGGGPMAEAVAAAPGVQYAGRLVGAEVAEFIAGCDLGLVPSLWDEPGLTFAALEWLGAGRPVLATARGGLAELPEAGVVRTDGTADGLRASLAPLLAPAAWRELLDSRPRVPSDDSARWLSEHRAVYDQALAAADRRAPVA